MATYDPDWELIRKFRYMLPQVYTDLCMSHLCGLLDLSVDMWKGFFNKTTCYSTVNKNAEPVVTHKIAVEIEYLVHQLKKGCNLKTRLLFRKPSSMTRSNYLRKLLADRRFAEIELGHFTSCDFAEVLKRILWDPREPLLTSAFYVICCRVQGLVKPTMERYEMAQAFEKQIRAICILFLMLPEDNYLLMQELLFMLYNIHLLRDHNEMNAHSLAICLAPALVYPRQFTMKEFNRNSTDAVWALEFMIENAPSLFVVPRQLVEDVKVQLARQWYISCRQTTTAWQDLTVCEHSDSCSFSSPEYVEPSIKKLQKPSKSNCSSSENKLHKYLCTSESWSFYDLRASHMEDNKENCKFDEPPSLVQSGSNETLLEGSRYEFPSSPPSLDELDSLNLDERDSSNLDERDASNLDERDASYLDERNASNLAERDASNRDELDASNRDELDYSKLDELDSSNLDSVYIKNRVGSESFWPRRKGFFRKLFPGKEHKNKSLNKKKWLSWFTGFKDKENVKMPPEGHAGSEKGLHGIRSYHPSAMENENLSNQDHHDSNHNLVLEHLRVQSVGKVESQFGDYHTLRKNATCTEVQQTLTETKSPRENKTCTKEQQTFINKDISKNTNTCSPTADIFSFKSFRNDSWITDRESSVSSNVFRRQEDVRRLESLH